MEAVKCIKERRSVRQYTDAAIPKNILEEIIDCGRLAPSANNIQPWEFVVITDKEKLRKISRITDQGYFIKHAAACVVVCCKNTRYYLEDGCIASQNILLAAKAFNIGSCWVAGDKKPYLDEVRELLGIPKDMKIVSILSLGYPKGEVKPRSKRKLDEVLHWNVF